MNVQNQFTPEEIQALVSGQPVSKSSKTPAPAPKAPVNPDAPAPQSFRPKYSVPINDRVEITRPNIKDKSGKRISPDQIVNVSRETFDRIDEDQQEAKRQLEAQTRAARELQQIASPANLLNQINAQSRLIDKLTKKVDSLTKKINGLQKED